MEKYNLPKGWKYEVFDKNENPIAKYYSALTDYGEMIKFSEITHPKNSNMFAEFDDYINIKKAQEPNSDKGEEISVVEKKEIFDSIKNIEDKIMKLKISIDSKS